MQDFAKNYASQCDEIGAHPAKHIINSLTMIAEENQDQQVAGVIATVIKQKLAQVHSPFFSQLPRRAPAPSRRRACLAFSLTRCSACCVF